MRATARTGASRAISWCSRRCVDGRRVDLSVVPGLPGFLPVVAAVLAELSVEEALIATELAHANPVMHTGLLHLLEGIPVRAIPHADFKLLLPAAKGLVRTGECTPYSNLILRSGTDGIFAPSLDRLSSQGTL
jgi:D-ribose pyranase